jgi:peptidoglycan/LPS O-acetylase OafA/YrhL
VQAQGSSTGYAPADRAGVVEESAVAVRSAVPPASASLRANNFDLIRLFAASQVLFYHAVTHLKVGELISVGHFLNYFPGVPVFFVISGFLISMSWERAPSPRQYAWNRILRIYPALWVCLLVSIAIFLACGVRPASLKTFVLWTLAQATLFQYYNPEFLRGFGVGVINGSLWTIPVELEFYILLPLLAIAANGSRKVWAAYAIAAAVMMVLARHYSPELLTIGDKLLWVSIIPYLFYFLVGVLTRYLYERYPGLLSGKALQWAAAYGAWIAFEMLFDVDGRAGNQLNIASIILLAMLTVSAALSRPELCARILRGNDISYGVYIYHMPVINLLLFGGFAGLPGFAAATVATLLCATLSWFWIERPALGLKNYSLRRAK